MSKYFIDPYKNYYEKLSSASSIIESANSLKSSVENAVNAYGRLSSQVETSLWKELGYTALASSSIPSLLNYAKVLNENIASGLVNVCNKCINELFAMLSSLKEKDELLESKEQQLASKKIENIKPTIPNGLGGTKTNPAYDSWKKEISALEEEISTLETELETLKQDIDTKVNDIIALNGSITYSDLLVSTEAASTTGETLVTTTSMTGSNYKGQKEYYLKSSMYQGKSGNMLNYGEYSVVDTKLSVAKYADYIQSHGLTQTKCRAMGNECLLVSKLYAYDLLTGKVSPNGNAAIGKYSFHGRFNKEYTDDNEQKVLEQMYYYLKSGIPVSINVNQQAKGKRHWVTVVGMKSSVTSAEDLKATDLLILDTYDGNLERMDCSDSRKFSTGYETGQKYGYRFDAVNDATLKEFGGTLTFRA